MTQLIDIPIPTNGFQPAGDEVRKDPYPQYHWLLRNDPVHRGAMGIWFVSRYADVRTVLGDGRFGRAGIRDFWVRLMGPGPLGEIIRHTILFQDEPDHTRLRTVVGPAFAPVRLRALERRIGQIVDDLLAAVRPRGAMDVINDLAYPLALTVISEIIGLPVADRARIRAWSLAIGPTLDLAASPAEIACGQAAIAELAGYLTDLIATRRDRPGDDLITAMLAAGTDGTDPRDGRRPHVGDRATMSTDEIVSMIITLIFAGHETVTNQLGNAVLALLEHPAQLALLRGHPERIPDAVEECLRFDSSVQSNSRQAAGDVQLGGRTIAEGDLVVVLLGAANRDPARFENPDRFDVTRTEVHPMSFGGGARYCLGAILARLELAVALGRLVELDGLAPAVRRENLDYQRSTMFRGVLSLPVTFAPGGPA